jgi:hypothetical protein
MKIKSAGRSRRYRIRVAHFGAPPIAPLAHNENYDRDRDLPRLLPLMVGELDVAAVSGQAALIERLRDALRKERMRGRHGHWSYDVGRHAALLQAYRCEMAHFREWCKRADRPGESKAWGRPRDLASVAQAISRGGCPGPSFAPGPSGRRRS